MGANFNRFREGGFAQGLKKGLPIITGLAGGIGGSMLGGPMGGWTGAKAGATLGLMAGGAGQQLLNKSGGGAVQPGQDNAFQRALTGSPGGIQTVPKYRPNQEQYMDELLPFAMRGIQNPYEGFEPIAQYARKNFQEQTIPQMMQNFVASGSNAPTSPGPWNQQGRAAEGMEANLAALQSQYGLQNRGQMMNLLGMGLTPRDAMFEQQAKSGVLDEYLPGLSRVMNQFGSDAVIPWLKKLFGLDDEDSDVQKDLKESAGGSDFEQFQPMNSFQDVMKNSVKSYRRSV